MSSACFHFLVSPIWIGLILNAVPYCGRIPRMISFLTHLSIYNGETPDTCIHLSADVIRNIQSINNHTVNGQIALLALKETLCSPRTRLDHKIQDNSNSVIIKLKTQELSATMGILVTPGLQSRCSNELCTPAQSEVTCTMQQCALALSHVDRREDRISEMTWSQGDPEVMFAVALAIVARDHWIQAHPLLLKCAQETLGFPASEHATLFPIITEFVKCSNVLRREVEGEQIALQALNHPAVIFGASIELCSLQLALVDSLIGQSKYTEAEERLRTLAAIKPSSSYIREAMDLRLSKVLRRLGVVDCSAIQRALTLSKTFSPTDGSNNAIIAECLDECFATVSCF